MAKQLAIVTNFKALVHDIAGGTIHAAAPTLEAYYRQPDRAAILRSALSGQTVHAYEQLGCAFEAIDVVVQWQIANGPSLNNPTIKARVKELTGLSEPDGHALYAHLKTTAKGLKQAMKLQGG